MRERPVCALDRGADARLNPAHMNKLIPPLLASVLWSPLALSADWETTLDAAIPSIVSIHLTATRAFATEAARTSYATGFVVDAERGIILTNRHVVNPGPVIAEATFANHEEVPLRALYRDPVHDFGFFQYDPADVRFLTPGALVLDPTAARVGLEVRVVGNDAGEKLSILGGTLARLDRDAPDYGRGDYNDFNTFYIQAASSTSGGSSGSPVLDEQGRVVALNAGSRRTAAASYYLPLDRVVRALALLRQGQPVTRGTLQAVLRYEAYGELRRLGLTDATEAAWRGAFPDATGMLVVRELVPGGPADGPLAPGDVLVSVNGERVDSFLDVDSILDDSVGKEISLEVERGGERVTVRLTVQDLHSITPRAYLEFGGGVVNPLSYQLARGFSVPAGAPMVAAGGHALAGAGLAGKDVITAVGGRPTPTLDALTEALAALPDRARVPVRYFSLDAPLDPRVAVLRVDRRWNPMRRCALDESTGAWPCEDAPPAPEAAPPSVATTAMPKGRNRVERALAASLVTVAFEIPFRVEGVYGSRFRGTGLILDVERGLVLVDRDTVPISLGDMTITFAGSVEVPGRVVALHPEHNVAIVAYDPALIGDTPVRSARLLPRAGLEEGDRVWHVGLNSRYQVVSRGSRVSRISPLSLGLPSPPGFRDANLDVISPSDAAPSTGGALADRRGRVAALWASFVGGGEDESFFAGLDAAILADLTDPILAGEAPVWRSLGVEWRSLALVDAAERGLPLEEARRRAEADGPLAQVLAAVRVSSGAPAAGLVAPGDLLVAVDGVPVTRAREVEVACQATSARLSLMRDGVPMDVEVPTAPLDGFGAARVLMWAGAILQDTPAAAQAQRGINANGAYITWTWYGSPASRYGLRPTRRVVSVNGAETADLAAFTAVVTSSAGPWRLTTEDLDGKVEVLTLEEDSSFWPTWELVREGRAWSRREAVGGGASTQP